MHADIISDICHHGRFGATDVSHPRRRTVTKKAIPFDRQVVTAAIAQAELSHSAVARELGVPLRTWMRWMEKGAIPAGYVTDVVLLLGLPEPPEEVDVPRTPWLVLRKLEEVVARVERVERRVDGEAPGQGGSRDESG